MQRFRVEKQIKFTSWRTETFYVDAESIDYVKQNLDALREIAERYVDHETILELSHDTDKVCWLINDIEVNL